MAPSINVLNAILGFYMQRKERESFNNNPLLIYEQYVCGGNNNNIREVKLDQNVS